MAARRPTTAELERQALLRNLISRAARGSEQARIVLHDALLEMVPVYGRMVAEADRLSDTYRFDDGSPSYYNVFLDRRFLFKHPAHAFRIGGPTSGRTRWVTVYRAPAWRN